ncbi:hypothetical protein MTR_6g007710 [Medicago truncatula]|uniref:Late nodulin n=1 Tax=Medicago truncatula TaxID=3880 RepID=A0A072U6B2_MEDTR|nr:hypothetical protein MTR_6g007710 [Medicago truncatula]
MKLFLTGLVLVTLCQLLLCLRRKIQDIHCDSWSCKLQKNKKLKFEEVRIRPPILQIGQRICC